MLALAIPALIAGCGGDDDTGEDPQEVLDATFNNDTKISSGVLDLEMNVAAEGDQGGEFTVALSGPFQGDPEDETAVPQLDLTASASGEGGGQSLSFEGGLIVTEDNAFVEYGGETYEVGTQSFNQLKQQAESQAGATGGEDASSSFREGCEQAIEAQGGDPAACDFDVSAWFSELSNEGTEDVGGAEATHITGSLDVNQMLTDLFELGSTVDSAQVQGLTPEMIQSQLGQLEQAISEASFDVYSATEDDTLRGLDFAIGIDPSQIEGGEAAGVDSVDLTFSLEIADVGEEQTFEAPADAQPIDELLGQFGGSIPGLGGGALPGVTPGGGGIPGAGDPVTDCINQAETPDEISACLEQAQ